MLLHHKEIMPTRNSKTTENPAISVSWPVSVKQAAKITFAQSKHRTVQSIIYPSGKKTYWNKQHFGMRHWWVKRGVGFSNASNCPDASIEIALTFWLRNTRDISCRSNSKRLASTAVKIQIYVCHFWIQNNSFPQLLVACKRKRNKQYRIQLSTSPKPHQSRNAFASVRAFPKEQWYRAGVFFSPLPLALSFFCANRPEHNLPIREKIVLEQAAFWHEVREV